MPDTGKLSRFEVVVLVHLGAAYNLARWLTRDASGADDAVQDACLRAFRFFDSLQGPSPKAWFMAVVRNACLDWLKDQRVRGAQEPYDDELHASHMESTESAVARDAEARWVREGIAALPIEYREVLVLRELEELSYKDFSAIVGVPVRATRIAQPQLQIVGHATLYMCQIGRFLSRLIVGMRKLRRRDLHRFKFACFESQ